MKLCSATLVAHTLCIHRKITTIIIISGIKWKRVAMKGNPSVTKYYFSAKRRRSHDTRSSEIEVYNVHT